MGVLAALAVMGGPSRVCAQITDEPAPPFPDPAKFSHGLYAEGEVGAVSFLGRAGDKMSTGVAVGARLGYEVFRWFAIQLHALGSTHQGSFENMPEAGQLMQLYQMTAEGKLTLTYRRVSVFGAGGGGIVRMSSNLLATVGLLKDPTSLNSVAFGGGGGIDWHTLNRHFSLGAQIGFLLLADVRESGLLSTTLYLRYTF
ncbi:MAG TPA: outer membrane beta-barrel protein [Polyangia bacterium]|nr:outer membrane beta-barrel protein [Polyangia bacterium]